MSGNIVYIPSSTIYLLYGTKELCRVLLYSRKIKQDGDWAGY